MKVFKEEQKFTQWWLYAILLFSLLVMLLPFFTKQNSIASAGEIINEVMIAIILLIGIIVFIVSIRLDTKIDEQGIYYRFFPIQSKEKFIPWNELNKAYVRKYNAISDYGGWGIKVRLLRRKSKGIAFNVKGNIGLQLELQNGKKILIGTQKEEGAKRVLITYADKIINHEN